MNHQARLLPLFVWVLLHLGCGGPGSSPAPGDPATPAMVEGFVKAAEDVQLFYRMVGGGPDTVIVLHGGPGFSMEYLADDLEPLAEEHTLLFYDQRGSGRSSLVSDSTALDAQRFADDLEAVRIHFGLESVILLGHSWGAGVAALYLARHPGRVERLLIVGGIPLWQGSLTRAFDELAARRDNDTRQRLQESREAWHANPGDATACRAYYVLWFLPFYGDSAAASRSKGDFCAGPAEALRNKVSSVDRFTTASLGEWDWRPTLDGVTAPTLIIHGTSDPLPVEGARQWAAALPDSRLLLLEGIGHFSYVEAPERFFAAVDEFLKGTWPEGAGPAGIP